MSMSGLELYIGVSGAGKTYQLKHKVLDLISLNYNISNKYKICVVGREYEWKMISGIELIYANQFKPEMLESIISSPDTILILDSIELYASDDFNIKLLNLLEKFSSNLVSVILSCHSYDQIPLELIKSLNSVYIGKLFSSDLLPLCDILGIDYKYYEVEYLSFTKKDLRSTIKPKFEVAQIVYNKVSRDGKFICEPYTSIEVNKIERFGNTFEYICCNNKYCFMEDELISVDEYLYMVKEGKI